MKDVEWCVWEPQEPEAGFAERVLVQSLADRRVDGARVQATVEGIAWSAWEPQEPEPDFASQVIVRALVEPIEQLRAPATDNVKAWRRKKVVKWVLIGLAACLLQPALALAGELLKSYLWPDASSASLDESSTEVALTAGAEDKEVSAASAGAASSAAPAGAASSAAAVALAGPAPSAAYAGAPSSPSTAPARSDQGTPSPAANDIAPPRVARGPFDEKAARAEIDRVLQIAKARCKVPAVFNNRNGFIKVTFSGSGELSGGISVAASELNGDADAGVSRHELDQVHTCVNMHLGFLVNIKPFDGPPQTITHSFRF